MSVASHCHGCGAELPPSLNPGTPRKWCSGRCRKRSYGDPCVDCGTQTRFGAETARVPEPRCIPCAAVHRFAEQRALVERLWAEGKTGREIASVLGQKVVNISTLRNQQGYNLPPRRTPEQIARITAGSGVRLRRARAAQGRAA